MKKSKKLCCQTQAVPSPLFQKVQSGIQTLIPYGQKVQYGDDQVLFYEGHVPCGFFLLEDGKVVIGSHVIRKEADEAAAEAHFVGLAHFLSQTPYCKTGRTVGGIQAIFFPKIVVAEFLADEWLQGAPMAATVGA